MNAILYIGHGTRLKMGIQEVESFLKRVIQRIDVSIQEISFLELAKPSIEDGFVKCVERGATNIIVSPIFLLPASHIKIDIPQILENLMKRYPSVQVEVRNPLGLQNQILDGMVEHIKEKAIEISPHDSILIVGIGGDDPAIREIFQGITEGLSDRLGCSNISVCYIGSSKPGFEEALTLISKRESRIIVVPYLLFSGLLLNVIKQSTKRMQKQGQAILQTEPLGNHYMIEEIVIRGLTPNC
ncbi:MAG: sirohydrochlorin chelatase [Bacillota bacterium]|nr:sirohydrochlorin chelatase [Bacillota bacterium]